MRIKRTDYLDKCPSWFGLLRDVLFFASGVLLDPDLCHTILSEGKKGVNKRFEDAEKEAVEESE